MLRYIINHSPFYKSDSRQAVNHVTEVVEHHDSNMQVVVFWQPYSFVVISNIETMF